MEGIFREDRLHAKHGQAFEAPGESGLGLKGLYHVRDACPIDLGLKVRPAGNRRKNHELFRRKLQRRSLLPLVAGSEFLGTVEPMAYEGRAGDQRGQAALYLGEKVPGRNPYRPAGDAPTLWYPKGRRIGSGASLQAVVRDGGCV